MRGFSGMMGMQKAGGLLGVYGEGMIDSNAESRARIMTPQREYPIFTPGFREPGVLQLGSNNSDQSRGSYADAADGQGIWKEIHTDTGHGTSISFDTGHHKNNILTVSATTPEQQQQQQQPSVFPNSPRPEPGRNNIAMNTTNSSNNNNYYNPVPSTPTPNSYTNMPGIMRRGSSPAMVPHSPQNVNILSPQLRPLERSPKRTQLHIASPRVTENGGLTPMVNQLTLSPATFDHHDVEIVHTNNIMLPPVARSPHQGTSLSTPASTAQTPMRSSVKLKKMMKAGADPTVTPARPSVSKSERSPGRTWRSSFRATAVSPAMATTTTGFRGDQQQNNNGNGGASRGVTREVNGSFQGSSDGRGATAATCVNSSSVPSWRGCGQAMVAPAAFDREICQEFSGELERPDATHHRVGGKKVPSAQKSGSYNIFNFLSRGKKKNGITTTTGSTTMKLTATTNDSFLQEYDDVASVKTDSDSIKVLDYTIKTLRYKLEEVNQKRATAVDEVRALQSALESSDEKCRQLTQRCQELELKLSARSSGLWDMELELEHPNNNNMYIVARREPNPPQIDVGTPQRFLSHELTPEQFLKVFEESITTLRKLASTICHHIRENGESATQVITALLEQHKVGRAVSRMPRNVIILYFESFLNQVMFESFENVSFEPNGASSVFCPDTLKQHSYQSFQSLKNQEWSTIEKSLGKPSTLVVNPNFHRFFVVRMELILSQLGKLAENEISLSLMASFFDAVKSVWLVHHMAFAFDQPGVSIFRVSPASEFDGRFMEQVTAFDEEQAAGVRSKVSIMLNPGFIVNRQIIKCQVYCSSKYE